MICLDTITDSIGFGLPFVINLIITGAVALFGYYKLKSIESLKRENQKQLFIHQRQFEKEFDAYSQIWNKIVEIRESIENLRPISDRIPEGKSFEELNKERHQLTTKQSNELIDLTWKNKPFYSPEVFLQLQNINKLIRTELREAWFNDKSELDYWEKGKKAVNNYVSQMEGVSDAIRNRIGIMEKINN